MEVILSADKLNYESSLAIWPVLQLFYPLIQWPSGNNKATHFIFTNLKYFWIMIVDAFDISDCLLLFGIFFIILYTAVKLLGKTLHLIFHLTSQIMDYCSPHCSKKYFPSSEHSATHKFNYVDQFSFCVFLYQVLPSSIKSD